MYSQTRPFEKWLKNKYVEWLNRAGMSTKGSRSDLKERFFNCREDIVTVYNDVGAYIKNVVKIIV